MNHILISSHIFLAIISQLVAVMTTVCAIVFLVQQRKLKLRKLEFLTKPQVSLESLEKTFSKLLLLGLVLLSLTLTTGFVVYLFFNLKTKYMSLKIIWALLVWLWYLVSFFFKEKYLRSRTVSAQMCSVGCLFLLTAWFGFIF